MNKCHPRVLVAIVLALIASACTPRTPKSISDEHLRGQWHELKARHFTLQTDLDENDARETLERLEQWCASRAAYDDRIDLSIIERATGEWAGEVVLNELVVRNQSCGFRIALQGSRFYGRGLGTEATLIYPSVTLANMGAIPGLVSRQDLLVVDQHAHNSIQEGAKIAKANGVPVLTFTHCDPVALTKVFKDAPPYRCAVVAIDDGAHLVYDDGLEDAERRDALAQCGPLIWC